MPDAINISVELELDEEICQTEILYSLYYFEAYMLFLKSLVFLIFSPLEQFFGSLSI